VAAVQEFERDAPGLVQVAAPYAELPVHHRRIVEDDVPLAGRRPVAVHQFERRFGERLCQFARVGDRGRRTDELRPRSIELADAPQPAQDVGQVAAINATVVVQLVNHDVAQILEHLGPARVVREDAAMEHVGIGEHHVGALADGFAGVLRRIAIVGEGPDIGPHRVHQGVELVELVFG